MRTSLSILERRTVSPGTLRATCCIICWAIWLAQLFNSPSSSLSNLYAVIEFGTYLCVYRGLVCWALDLSVSSDKTNIKRCVWRQIDVTVIIRREEILSGRYKTKLELYQLNLATILWEEGTTVGNVISANDSERSKQKSGCINSLLHFVWFRFVMSSLLLKLLCTGLPLAHTWWLYLATLTFLSFFHVFSHFSPLPLDDAFLIFLRQLTAWIRTCRTEMIPSLIALYMKYSVLDMPTFVLWFFSFE